MLANVAIFTAAPSIRISRVSRVGMVSMVRLK